MTKRPFTTVALAAVLALLTSGCLSGPSRFTRSWDDYVNQKYSESSIVHGAILQTVLPVYPIVGQLLAFVDVLIVNPYYFWTDDLWDGEGTGFVHENPIDAEKTVSGFSN